MGSSCTKLDPSGAVIDASRFFNQDVKLWDEATQAEVAQWCTRGAKSSGYPARVSSDSGDTRSAPTRRFESCPPLQV